MSGTVLVTGGSGYIAGYLIRQLVTEGWTVHTTVRSLAKEAGVRELLQVDNSRLTFFAADLMADAGWAEAVAGCSHVAHVASPLPTGIPKDANELIVPARDGVLRAQIEGDVLRHYPDTDTLEIDNPRIRAIGRDGQITRASAKRALSNKDGSELQLQGDAHVIREPLAGQPAVDFRGEFLHAFLDTEQVRSHLPVVVTQGATVLHAAGLNYDNLAGVVDLKGPVRAVFQAAARPTRKLP